MKKVFDELIEKPEIRKLMHNTIKDNILCDLGDNCVFNDLVEDAFNNCEIRIVPKEKESKTKKS